jgi:large subunit ribosomal protein L4
MYKATYYKSDGTKGRARALPEDLFDGRVNEAVLHQVIKVTLANRRQGTAAGKNRSAVRGGSRKPWRQKGTGRARQGTIRAAQWSGGGLAFPPQPHSWRQKVPRKVRSLARRSAFNARAEDGCVVLVDDFSYEAPKTARLAGFLAAIEATGKVLVLTAGNEPNVVLSARNIPGVEVRTFGSESAYDILWAQTIVIERSALEASASRAGAGESPVTEAEPAGDTAPANDEEEGDDA